MEKEEILGILESFHFFAMPRDKRQRFLEHTFQIIIDETEVFYPISQLIELIQIRLEQTKTCPECHGFGCRTCRGTGKKSVYR